MISTNDLKRVFSKAYITICDGCVSVNYVSSEENKWSTQCFSNEDNTKEVLETLISNTKALTVSVSPENGVKIEFLTCEEIGVPEVLVYFPMKHDLTEKELSEFIEKHKDGIEPKIDEFLDQFTDVDLGDETDVLAKLSELITRVTDAEDIINFEGVIRWTSLCEKASAFSEKHKFGGMNVLRPDTDWDGCVTLSTSVADGCRFWCFSEEGKAELLELILDSTEVSIECGVTEDTEILSITFFA